MGSGDLFQLALALHDVVRVVMPSKAFCFLWSSLYTLLGDVNVGKSSKLLWAKLLHDRVNVVVRCSDGGGENAEEENNDNLHGGRLGVKCCSKLFKDDGQLVV